MTDVGTTHGLEQVTCTSVPEFLEWMRLTHSRWSGTRYSTHSWVFRGHANANWDLVAAAHRLHAWTTEHSAFAAAVARSDIEPLQISDRLNGVFDRSNSGERDYLRRVCLEMHAICDFCTLADELGFSVPGVPADYLDRWVCECKHNNRLMPASSVIDRQACALAQHHGVPTGLLDWTRRPLVAAMFAASGVRQELSRANAQGPPLTELAVWALNAEVLMELHGLVPFTLSRPPLAKIKYMRAQDGLFTEDAAAHESFQRNARANSLEVLFSSIRDHAGKPGLVRITLPVTLVDELLKSLWVEYVSPAHLKPSLDEVARSLKYSWLWSH